MISALNGDGVRDLKTYLAQAVPPGPWLYPEDQLTDAPLRQAAAEITREKLFLRLHDELPYTLTVETADWKELKDGSVRIEQTIYRRAREPEEDRARRKAARPSRRSVRWPRAEIGEMVGAPVHLFLFVKVREHWGEDPERYREMGLDYPKEWLPRHSGARRNPAHQAQEKYWIPAFAGIRVPVVPLSPDAECFHRNLGCPHTLPFFGQTT